MAPPSADLPVLDHSTDKLALAHATFAKSLPPVPGCTQQVESFLGDLAFVVENMENKRSSFGNAAFQFVPQPNGQ
jgi:hypothetical protein